MTNGTVILRINHLWRKYHPDWTFGRFIATVINGSCYDNIYEISDEDLLEGIETYLKEQEIMEEIAAGEEKAIRDGEEKAYWDYVMQQAELYGEINREY